MKIICIGRNYLEHAKEMGKSITKEPIFFLKPDSSLIAKKQPFFSHSKRIGIIEN